MGTWALNAEFDVSSPKILDLAALPTKFLLPRILSWGAAKNADTPQNFHKAKNDPKPGIFHAPKSQGKMKGLTGPTRPLLQRGECLMGTWMATWLTHCQKWDPHYATTCVVKIRMHAMHATRQKLCPSQARWFEIGVLAFLLAAHWSELQGLVIAPLSLFTGQTPRKRQNGTPDRKEALGGVLHLQKRQNGC
jgi:hypothetical protein